MLIALAAAPKGFAPRHLEMCIRDRYMDEVRSIFPRAKAARDGWTLELEFDED